MDRGLSRYPPPRTAVVSNQAQLAIGLFDLALVHVYELLNWVIATYKAGTSYFQLFREYQSDAPKCAMAGMAVHYPEEEETCGFRRGPRRETYVKELHIIWINELDSSG